MPILVVIDIILSLWNSWHNFQYYIIHNAKKDGVLSQVHWCTYKSSALIITNSTFKCPIFCSFDDIVFSMGCQGACFPIKVLLCNRIGNDVFTKALTISASFEIIYFLNIFYFFKYSCTNILHRRSPCTFYNSVTWSEERFLNEISNRTVTVAFFIW